MNKSNNLPDLFFYQANKNYSKEHLLRLDPNTNEVSCGRTNDEKAIWKNEDTSNEWKINQITEIKSRLSGWQLSSFEESYNFKQKNGVSLLKHKLLNK